MKITQIRMLVVMILAFFESYWNKPQIRRIAVEVKEAIETLFDESDFEESEFAPNAVSSPNEEN